MIYLLSSDIGQYDRFLLDNWAFAGTIVSIILAVIAILYTFDQGSTTIHSTRKLEESAVKIAEVSDTLKDNDIKSLVEELENKITGLIDGVQTGLGNRLDNHFEMINTLTFQRTGKSSPIESSDEYLTKEQWDSYVKKYIVENLNLATLSLLFFYMMHKTGIQLEISEIAKWIKENTDLKLNLDTTAHSILGSSLVFNTLNVIEIESDVNDKLEITYFSGVLMNCIDDVIDDANGTVVKKLKNKFL